MGYKMKIKKALVIYAEVLLPPEKLTVSEWADKYRYLSPESAVEPGKWHTARAEYQRGMMDAVNEPGVEEIVFMTSAQVGKSEVLNNILAYFIAQDPCPIAFMQPNILLAQDYKKDRIYPMFRDTPKLSHLATTKRTKGVQDTTLHTSFKGGNLTLLGSNSPANLAGRPKRVVLVDEIDRMEVTKEGDNVAILFKRANNFWNRKKISAGTPTNDLSRVFAKYLSSDMRKNFVKCPLCEKEIIFHFDNLEYEVDKNNDDVQSVMYRCGECEKVFSENYKAKMIAKGVWRSTNLKGKRGLVGFWINELYSPWRRWVEIIEDYLEAKKTEETLRVWVNTSKGEIVRKSGLSPDWKRLYNRREDYVMGTIPNDKILSLTAGVDIQGDRIHIEVVGWGADLESWSLNYIILNGSPSEAEVWEKLDVEITRIYYREDGKKFTITLTAIDAGYFTQTVYNFVRRYSRSRVIAIMGSASATNILSTPKRIDYTKQGKKKKRGLLSWLLGVSILKRELYSFLEIEEKKENVGFCHFPMHPEGYFKELTAEYIVKGFDKKGFPIEKWEKSASQPNEAMDCRNYARACAVLLRLDNLSSKQIERLEQQITKEFMPLTKETRTNSAENRRLHAEKQRIAEHSNKEEKVIEVVKKKKSRINVNIINRGKTIW